MFVTSFGVKKKGVNNMKKIMLAAGAALSSVALFAEETSGSTTTGGIDLSDALSDFLTPIQNALSAFLPTVIPVVAAVAGLGLVFFLAKWGLRLVKSFMSSSSR